MPNKVIFCLTTQVHIFLQSGSQHYAGCNILDNKYMQIIIIVLEYTE